MMDKKTYNANDEEYQFQESDSAPQMHSTTGHTDTVPTAGVFERINRQHLVAGVMFILLAYGAYKLLHWLFYATLTTPQTRAKIQKTTPPTPGGAADIPLQTPADVVKNRLDQLAKGQLDTQSAVRALDSQLSDVHTSLAYLTKQIEQSSDELKGLQSGQALLMQKQTKPLQKIDEKKKNTLRAIYYVHAMIPGRVWFTTPTGSTTLTLGVGDTLTGYGFIEAINPERGIVTFSSGAVIGYRPEDR